MFTCHCFNKRNASGLSKLVSIRDPPGPFFKVGPHRTRTEETQKSRTNSHRAVRGPGGAWILGQNINIEIVKV